MKKIMKKALSLVLALVMVFALTPMTAKAAAGDAIENSSVQGYYDGITAAAGETIYVEMSGADGEYNVTVASTDSFTVTPCDAGTSTWYNEGSNSVASTNNEVETTMGFYYGYGALAITNTSSQECSYTCTVDFPEGTQSNPKAITLGLEGTESVTVPAGGQYYVSLKLPEIGVQYNLKMTGNTGFGYSTNPYMQPAWDTNGVYTTAVMATDMSGSVTFIISNNTQSENTITLDVNAQEIGEKGNPDTLTVGTKITKAVDGAAYWYKWTPAVDGTLTITVDEAASAADGWYVEVSSHSIQKSNCWDNAAEFTFDVTAGVEVVMGVSVPGLDSWGELSPYGYGTGNVVFTATFAEPTTEGDGSGEGDGADEDEGTGTDTVTGEEINSTYYYNYTTLGTGTVMVFPQFGYTTTLYTFTASEAGTYTVTLSDTTGTVGYYGSNEYFPYDYSQDTGVANTYTYTLNYKEANAPALIGISGTTMTDITITRTGDVEEEEEIPSENAYPTVSLGTYVFDGDVDALDRFMYAYEDVDALMGEDGYFHVVSLDDIDENGEYVGEKALEDCPILLVKLNDPTISLASAIGYGSVKWVAYDENGDATQIIYFNDMLEEYISYSSTDAMLYPATEDLIYTMVLVGADQGWYEEDGFVTAAFANDNVPEDALWTFAMYYLDQDITTLDKEEPVVGKDDMTTIITANKDKDVVINTVTTNAAGEEVVVKFEFAANTMEAVEGKDNYSFKVELVEDYNKATEDKAEINKDEFVIRINFEYEGKLPAEAAITIPVGTEFANKTLYYYQILSDGTLKYVCDAPVDANGNAKVTQDHCSDYVLLEGKVPVVTPDTGDNTNLVLWVSILALGVVAIAGSVVMKKREF